jgi:hypothetical protein
MLQTQRTTKRLAALQGAKYQSLENLCRVKIIPTPARYTMNIKVCGMHASDSVVVEKLQKGKKKR